MSLQGKPFFSIVIPTKNRNKELLDSITSVINQNFHQWELIVVEDGSAQQNAIVQNIQALGDSRIKVISLENSINAAGARNIGIDEATGDWIAFLDSDDSFMPKKLSTMYQQIQADQCKDVIYYSQFINSGKDYDRLLPSRPIRENEKIGDYLFFAQEQIGTPGLVVPAALARDVRFSEWCIKHQDYDFMLRAEAKGAHYELVNKPLWKREFRKGDENVGAIYNPRYAFRWLKAYSPFLSEQASYYFMVDHILSLVIAKPLSIRLKSILGVLRDGNYPRKYLKLMLACAASYSLYRRLMDTYDQQFQRAKNQ